MTDAQERILGGMQVLSRLMTWVYCELLYWDVSDCDEWYPIGRAVENGMLRLEYPE